MSCKVFKISISFGSPFSYGRFEGTQRLHFLHLLNPKNKGTTLLSNEINYLPVDKA